MSESYKPKVVRARLKTGGKTVQSIREKLTGRGFTVRDFQSIIKAGNYLDGLEVQLSLQNWDNYENWHLWNWKQEDDEKVMLAMYQAEQFHPFAAMRNYKNNFEQFKEDWKKEEYDPGASYTFSFDEVEVLEVLQEEVNNIEPGTVEKAVRTTKAIKEQQYYHRKKKRAAKRSKYTYHKKKVINRELLKRKQPGSRTKNTVINQLHTINQLRPAMEQARNIMREKNRRESKNDIV